MPFDFGQPMKSFTSKFNAPTPGGYKFRITGSSIEEWKGKPKWVLSVDIAEGPFTGAYEKFPRKVFQDLSTDVGKSIAKRILETIINDNVGMVNPSILEDSVFDESVVVGLFVGGIMALGAENPKTGKRYLNVETLCPIEVAMKDAPKLNTPF